jgi:DNA-directed RNA polymerase specialized sigma24 family protein
VQVADDSERYVNLPSFIFKDRSLAALEAIVVYLKDSQGMTYAQIAKLLNRDDRTIWTTYQRAKKKLGVRA